MAEGGEHPKRIIIPKGTLQPGQDNVIEIPDACEESRILIAKLQARFSRPPRYYPPRTNPDNKFERTINERVVGLGVPPLSPLKEEPHRYQYSLSQYGSPKPIPYESYEPSYFGHDTTHGDMTISGKFDYCPSSTPKATRPNVGTEFPSPKLSPIRMGRDIFAPDPSVYRSAYTPTRTPPRQPSPEDDCSCPTEDISGSSRGSSRRSPSPRAPSPRRSPSPQPAPSRRPQSPVSDRSCSLSDISGMLSFDASRGNIRSLDRTPESVRGMSQIYRNIMATPSTPIPEELHNKTMNDSMAELDFIELDELRTVHERMRNFQDARRELVLSILALPEAEVSM